MFEDVIARFDELFERHYPSATPASAELVERIGAFARVENRAAAEQLTAIGDLFSYRLSRCSECEEWAVDTEAAVSAEVAAELRISQGLAASRVRYARAMRERLPEVGAVFRAGGLDFRLFATIVYRTDLITDHDVLAAVDAELAIKVPRWPSMTQGRLAAQVDKIVARNDADAVRRRTEHRTDRQVWVADMEGGLAHLEGSLLRPDAHALDQRLDALAATVCEKDPRSRDQRRADALGALAAGADRLGCRCGSLGCTAEKRRAAGPVVIHVVAEHSTLGGGQAPAVEVGAEGLIPPELIAELAASATLVPLVHPLDSAPEPRYAPSKALADFVRCRDLTCRWPGCDCPATDCDVDHTIPYSDDGPTHASNLKCYCRTHHLVKTFWGWQEKQLPDGSLILNSPAGRTYVTHPGSSLLFPSLCRPAAEASLPARTSASSDRCGEREAMMPKRRRTRAQNRAHRVATERRRNHHARQSQRRKREAAYFGPAPPADGDDDPPPF